MVTVPVPVWGYHKMNTYETIQFDTKKSISSRLSYLRMRCAAIRGKTFI